MEAPGETSNRSKDSYGSRSVCSSQCAVQTYAPIRGAHTSPAKSLNSSAVRASRPNRARNARKISCQHIQLHGDLWHPLPCKSTTVLWPRLQR